ncbi:MAG: glycosyltransferase, partial [Gammaproteobacteria bacterium]
PWDSRGKKRKGTRRLFIISLWYFPSHFGVHVDDLAKAFAAACYDVTIVTVSRHTLELPYFDAFRDTFDVIASNWPEVVRLNVERLEERGAYNPYVFLGHDAVFESCTRQMEAAPCYLLHFFEMLVPYFNSDTVGSAAVTSVIYAGNFITRIMAQQDVRRSAGKIAGKLLARYASPVNDGFRLGGVDCVLSETKSLPPMLRLAGLRTPSYWASRPAFADPVMRAAPCDLATEFGIPKDAKVLLYAGRPAKNAIVLPSILARIRLRHPGELIVLLLIGPRPEEAAGWPGAAGQREWIRASPFVAREKLFGIMKAADVFVYPGLIDGYPKVISEAGFARLPVVAFSGRTSGLHEMSPNRDLALIVKTAASTASSGRENERFAGAVNRILDDRRLRDGLVARAFGAAKRMDAPRFVQAVERRWRRHERRNRPGGALAG